MKHHRVFACLLGAGLILAACGGGGSGGGTAATGGSGSSSSSSLTGFTANTDSAADAGTSGEHFQPAVTGLSNGNYVVAWTDTTSSPLPALPNYGAMTIKIRIYNASGVAQGSEILANTTTQGDRPSIAALAGGGFVLAWEDASGTFGDSSGSGIVAQRFDASGNKAGAQVLVNTATDGFQGFPLVRALSSGGYVVSWVNDGAVEDNIHFQAQAQVFDASGTKVGGEVALKSFATAGAHAGLYDLAGLSDGTFVMVYNVSGGRTGSTLAANIAAQVFNGSGVAQGAETFLNDSANDAASPVITATGSGRFAVAWQTTTASNGVVSNSAIRTRTFSNALATLGTEAVASTDSAKAETGAAIGGLANGGYVVTWSDTYLSGQAFTIDGAKLAGAFDVIPRTVSGSASVLTTAIAPGAGGGYAVVWATVPATGVASTQVRLRTYSPQFSN